MKAIPQPLDVMKTMHQYIRDAYNAIQSKEKGIIQFCLTDDNVTINCYFNADGNDLLFCEGISETYNVRLESTLSDWLALAEKRLNPFVGVLLRRLKFKGDVSCFRKIIPKELYNVDLKPYSDKVTQFETDPAHDWVKPKKVLLIDSSPRGTTGYTKLYSDHIEGFLQEKNIEVKHIMLASYKIQPCLGCLQCWLKREGTCIIKDDTDELYQLYEESDLIIYAFTLMVSPGY